MGDQVRELLNWARQRKILAAAFVGFTLVVGILIGSVVSGRVSATKGFGFPGTTATTLTVPDPIPATNSFAGSTLFTMPAKEFVAGMGSGTVSVVAVVPEIGRAHVSTPVTA